MDFNSNIASVGAGKAPVAIPDIDEAIEKQYNLRLRHPEREEVYAGFTRESALFRAEHGDHLTLRYGSGPRALADVFPAIGTSNPAPILIFIHGGYWRTLDKGIFSFIARAYVEAGMTVVMPSYDLAPSVTLGGIVAQMRELLGWVRSEAASFGGDASRIVLSGHSAGGHLAAILALLDGTGPEQGGIRGVIPVSGLFDLRPLRFASVNRDVRMSVEDTETLSPQLMVQRDASLRTGQIQAIPMVVMVGGAETDGFKEQSRDFNDAWFRCGGRSRVEMSEGCTHFTVLKAFADAKSAVFADILAMVGLTPRIPENS